MRLRSQFFLTMSLLISFILAFVALTLIAMERQFLVKETDRRQRAALESVAGIVREAHITRDPLLMLNYLKLSEQTYPEIGWLCIVDSEGKIQASLDINLFGVDRSSVSLPENIVLLSQEVVSNGRGLGRVEVGFDQVRLESYIQASLLKVRNRVTVIGLWALLLGFFGSLLLALNLTRPIRLLSDVANEIGKGKWDTPVPTAKRKDELGDLSRSFQKMTAQLKELDQMKQDFVASMTHELRSPLSIIESHANSVLQDLGQAQGLSQNDRNDWISSMAHIKDSAFRLSRFVTELLDIAKIERGKLDLNLQKVSLASMIHEILASLVPKAEEKKLTLYEQIGKDLPAIYADPDRIHQVFINLIGNALKFTPEGGKIIVGAQALSQGWVYVKVVDTGPGIPQEFMSRIFSKFEQVKGLHDRRQGTGLGLSICKGIIESHGGKIGVKLNDVGGSEFYFTLPMAENEKTV